MNEQDLKTVEEIKKDYKEILDSGERFHNLIEEYKKKYKSFLKENESELKDDEELIQLNEEGTIIFNKIINLL